MRRQKRESGILLDLPEGYEAGEITRKGRTRGGRGEAGGDDLILERLGLAGMTPVDTFEVRPAAARRRGGAPTAGAAAGLELDVQPGERAAVLLEEDGVYRWCFGTDVSRPQSRRRRGEPAATRLRFDFAPQPVASAARRRGLGGLLAEQIAGRVKAVVLKFAAGVVVGGATRILERNVHPGLVSMKEDDPRTWVPIAPETLRVSAAEPRVLLFVHGTFSSTANSYGALAATGWGRDLLQDLRGHYDAVIGYDHFTLSDDPYVNAAQILADLKRVGWRKPPVFDAVAYSRGGLVIRSLVEMLMPLETAWGARFEKVIFVGATNGGTLLAEPANWNVLIDLYTNLAMGAARAISGLSSSPVPMVVGGVLESVGELVKCMAEQAVTRGQIPGLAAMEPDGRLVRAINEHQPGQPTARDISYYAVTGNFEPRSEGALRELPKRFVQFLADRLTDQLMREANDLVVNTSSMTRLDAPGDGLLKETADFDERSGVYHTIYFTRREIAEALRRWLGLKAAAHEAPARGRTRGAQAPAYPLTYRSAGAAAAPPRARKAPAKSKALPMLAVEVCWGDIVETDADVYGVGHYAGVLPQRAELALDRALSGWKKKGDRLVLTDLSQRRMLRGELGEIKCYPWPDAEGASRTVAVCGMGHPGSFGESSLRLLHRNLSRLLVTLPGERTLSTVLIGSGEGGLSERAAIRGLLMGFADTLAAEGDAKAIRVVRIVELQKRKALAVHAALADVVQELTAESAARLPVRVDVSDELALGPGGRVSGGYAWAVALAGLAEATAAGPAAERALSTILAGVRAEGTDAEVIRAELRDLRKRGKARSKAKGKAKIKRGRKGAAGPSSEVAGILAGLSVEFDRMPGTSDREKEVSRLSFVREGGVYRAAAITDTTTVPERVVDVDPDLVREAVERMTDPAPEEVAELGEFLYRLVIPRDFRNLLVPENPLVLEVDRHTAPLHWEMLPPDPVPGREREPLGLSRVLARQLRTTYSPAPDRSDRAAGERCALVIGDPGDAAAGDDLAGARREAIDVARFLQQQGYEVDLLLGPPVQRREARGLRVSEASRIEALRLLMTGKYEIVHYSGHGDFDEEVPDRVGWVFHDGLMTAREISRIDVAPPLVVANACLSGRTSAVNRSGQDEERWFWEATLVPSLADEFFRRGVLNYIGTAWEVDDAGAVAFAQTLYGSLLQENSIGEAVLAARRTLRGMEDLDALWAAYQHYGDPGWKLGPGPAAAPRG